MLSVARIVQCMLNEFFLFVQIGTTSNMSFNFLKICASSSHE